ncbi:MAG: sigma-70 family RNA polymerase sigma factor [Verrucomicrobia bacterium]|nr:sigma-70 family RNA polymerase sigma factor [Verrucomicrobiota bacterium]
MRDATTMEPPGTAAPEADAPSDADLIAAINRGDAGAFTTLYHRHKSWVANLARRFTGDPDLALDVLQDTFLYLLRKFPGFQLTAQLKTFLYPAVRNFSIAARRKAARYQASPETVESALASLTTPPMSSDAELVAQVLARLPEDTRELLRLRFVDGLKLDELALAMDLPLGTVKSRLHYALQTLRSDPHTTILFEP